MSKQRKLSNDFNDLAAKQTIIIANIKLLTAFLRFIVLLKQIQATREKTNENAKHLSKGVSELRTSTKGEAFLILKGLDTIKFVFLSVSMLTKTVCPNI